MKIERILSSGLLAALFAAASLPLRAQAPAGAQKTFDSPAAAIDALRGAAAAGDRDALSGLFGPDAKHLMTGDPEQDAANFKRFARALSEKVEPVAEGASKVVLEVGPRGWPFPIPLVMKNGLWFFDTAAGKEEIVDRHVGKDELYAIGICRRFVRGYGPHNARLGQKPLHGYLFKVLSREGRAAPGGGLALVAYPERWGQSGILTFVVERDGRVFKRDLGAKSAELGAAIVPFTPDKDWTLEREPGEGFL